MLKNIRMPFLTLILILSTTHSFAISPGAGQVQIQNNLQQIQQNKQRVQQMQQNQQRIQQNKAQQQYLKQQQMQMRSNQ